MLWKGMRETGSGKQNTAGRNRELLRCPLHIAIQEIDTQKGREFFSCLTRARTGYGNRRESVL